MKQNKNIFNPKTWNIWMVIQDIKNYRAWVTVIKKEKSNPKSLWHKFNMKHNIFYIIYFMLTLPEEDKALPDNVKRMRVVESLAPIHRYIDEDLQFAEYIVPEFNQFYDEDDNPTLTYGIIYRFAFKKLSLKWFIYRTIFWGGLTFVLIKYPIISFLIEQFNWLISLI